MTIESSFVTFWNKSGFRKINRASCRAEFEAAWNESNSTNLSEFTDQLVKAARERLRFMRTKAGIAGGEQHPLTWLKNREFNNDAHAPLSKRQRASTRHKSDLRRQLKEVEASIKLVEKPDPFLNFRGDERRKLQLKGLQARKEEILEKIAEIADDD